jgi:very-short-patch-repair endonuclease
MRIWLTSFARTLRRRQTEAEARLWYRLRNRQMDGLKFRRQVPRGDYLVDFLCDEAMLVVELDGSQHGERVFADNVRTRYLESLGYTVLRFWNCDAVNNMNGVLETIYAAASARRKASSRRT